MYLKRLEMYGFKSFADKTILEFMPGITTVIGPNGSGKSNISDCIKLMLPPGTGSKEISDRVKEKKGNFVFLNKSKDEIEILIEERKKLIEKRDAIQTTIDRLEYKIDSYDKIMSEKEKELLRK